ncbi:MAG: 4Fe-4S dicluster domain-containing protein [Candidatus Dormibacteria bacterium]
MTYVIGETCVDVKDKSCVEVCPVDCIIGTGQDRMLYINPEECIDCGACVDPCPVDAIYAEEDLPTDWEAYTRINALYFQDPDAARAEVDALMPPLATSVSVAGERD